MKKTIFILLAIIGLGAGYAYYQANRPVESLTEAKADIITEASALIASFTTDETKANAAYLDKIVTVSGIVTKIEQAEGKHTIYLDGNNPMSAVVCEMEKNQKLDNISEGKSVSIKGKCTGFLSDVVLVQGVIN
jgi:hypothetical protein